MRASKASLGLLCLAALLLAQGNVPAGLQLSPGLTLLHYAPYQSRHRGIPGVPAEQQGSPSEAPACSQRSLAALQALLLPSPRAARLWRPPPPSPASPLAVSGAGLPAGYQLSQLACRCPCCLLAQRHPCCLLWHCSCPCACPLQLLTTHSITHPSPLVPCPLSCRLPGRQCLQVSASRGGRAGCTSLSACACGCAV